MRILTMEQGSPEWYQARLGIPTASCFDKILTPTGKSSTQASAYANTLLAEWLCGQPLEDFNNGWMERGKKLEKSARAYYQMIADADVTQVGLVLRDDGKAGCSPDGLVGDVGMLQIKVPAPHTHVGYLLKSEAPTGYYSQLQGEMYIAEREWNDFLSFHPLMPPVLVRVERDEKHIAKLIREIDALLEVIESRKAELIAKNITPLEKAA